MHSTMVTTEPFGKCMPHLRTCCGCREHQGSNCSSSYHYPELLFAPLQGPTCYPSLPHMLVVEAKHSPASPTMQNSCPTTPIRTPPTSLSLSYISIGSHSLCEVPHHPCLQTFHCLAQDIIPFSPSLSPSQMRRFLLGG